MSNGLSQTITDSYYVWINSMSTVENVDQKKETAVHYLLYLKEEKTKNNVHISASLFSQI